MDPEEIRRSVNKIKKENLYKGCLWNDENCNKIIRAHSIQESAILDAISEKSHVMYFYYDPLKGTVFERIGKGAATTFRGFCGYHDREIFKPIENGNLYKIGNLEQNYLFAYRSLAKEYHAKLSCKGMYSEAIEKISDETSDMVLNPLLEGTLAALGKFNTWNNTMKNNIINKDFEGLITKNIVFNKKIGISTSTVFFLEYDLKGNHLVDFSDINSFMRPLFLNIFPENDKTHVLISYFTEDKDFYEPIVLEIVNKPEIHQQAILSNIILIYVENFVMSPVLWESYGIKKQNRISELFKKTSMDKSPKLINKRDNLFTRKR